MLHQLTVSGFRNIERVELSPGQKLNFIIGDNGAGKSSLLEAVDFLSRGRTFRTRLTRPLFREGSREMIISAALRDGRRLGIRRMSPAACVPAASETRIDGEAVRTQSEMAAALPVVVFHAGTTGQARSETRHWQGVLDWGVFHMEPSFRKAWQAYQHALRQRNALLLEQPRAPASRTMAQWNQRIVQQGGMLDTFRRKYSKRLVALVEAAATEKGDPLEMAYFRGWPEGRDLEQILEADESGDRRIGYTRRGPHRATWRLLWDGEQASERASRGQLKNISTIIMLAQVQLFSEFSQHGCVVMMDDLTSEFDEQHSQSLLEDLERTEQQVFVTATEKTSGMVGCRDAKLFRIEQGQILK